MTSPPMTSLDLSGLSISSSSPPPPSSSMNQQRNDLSPHTNPSYDPTGTGATAYYSTAPSGAAPFAQQPYDTHHQQAHFSNTIASMGSKARGGLPSHWLEQSGNTTMSDSRSLSPPTDSSSPPQSSFLSQSVTGGGATTPGGSQTPQLMSPGGMLGGDDDIIPTAIVIKNIPFSVKRETLLEIIASLSIPTPYAFNYHVDAAGAFRGLAFANFRQAADADAVVAALNGFDVQGRKLRVEYKKVLQAGEKERIEKEKALRRMRSMQMEKERVAQQQQGGGGNGGNADWEDYGNVVSGQNQQFGNIGMGLPMSGGGGGGGYGMSPNGNLLQSPARSFSSGGGIGGMSPTQSHQMPSPNLGGVIPPVPQIPQQYYQPMPNRQTSQHQPPMLQVTTPPPHESPLDQYNQSHGGLRSFSPPTLTSTSPPPVSSLIQQREHSAPQFEPAVSPPSKNYTELDMNDASTLEIYSRILLFKDDRMRDELAFSRSLTAMERRVVHMVAKKLGLYHRSVGEGSERYAVVMRYPPDNSRPPPPARQPSGTLNRAQSQYLSASTNGPSGASPSRSGGTSSSSSALRAKKSMPDLSTLHAPQTRLSQRSSNGNIREGYATISGGGRRAAPAFYGLFGNNGNGAGGDGVPPVPTIPSNVDGNSLNSSIGPSGASVMRQPRGPTGDGFGMRRVGDLKAATISKGSGFGSMGNGDGLETGSRDFEI